MLGLSSPRYFQKLGTTRPTCCSGQLGQALLVRQLSLQGGCAPGPPHCLGGWSIAISHQQVPLHPHAGSWSCCHVSSALWGDHEAALLLAPTTFSIWSHDGGIGGCPAQGFACGGACSGCGAGAFTASSGRSGAGVFGFATSSDRSGAGVFGFATSSGRSGAGAASSGRSGAGAFGFAASSGRSGDGAFGFAASSGRCGAGAFGFAASAGRSGAGALAAGSVAVAASWF